MTDIDDNEDGYEGANPYNMRKPWHESEEKEVETANSVFVPPKRKAKPAQKDSVPADEQQPGESTHDFEKRYKDLKSHHDKTVRELREQIKGKEPEAVNENAFKPPKTKEDLAKFQKDNPELFATIQSVAHLMASEETSEVKTKLSEIDKERMSLAREKAMQDIRNAHPDIDELRNDEAFHTWAEEQPKQIQDWIYNNPTEGMLAVKAINLYKAEVASKSSSKTKSKPADGADSLVSTKTSQANVPANQKIWTRREINSLSVDDYDRYEKEIDLAIRQGRIAN